MLIAEMPELGQLSGEQAAALRWPARLRSHMKVARCAASAPSEMAAGRYDT